MTYSVARLESCITLCSPHVDKSSEPLDLDIRGVSPLLQDYGSRIRTGAQRNERLAQQDKVDDPADLEHNWGHN